MRLLSTGRMGFSRYREVIDERPLQRDGMRYRFESLGFRGGVSQVRKRSFSHGLRICMELWLFF